MIRELIKSGAVLGENTSQVWHEPSTMKTTSPNMKSPQAMDEGCTREKRSRQRKGHKTDGGGRLSEMSLRSDVGGRLEGSHI